MTPSEINPATFRFVGQCLNLLRYRVRPSGVLVAKIGARSVRVCVCVCVYERKGRTQSRQGSVFQSVQLSFNQAGIITAVLLVACVKTHERNNSARRVKTRLAGRFPLYRLEMTQQ
jgi:hypothetical protein